MEITIDNITRIVKEELKNNKTYLNYLEKILCLKYDNVCIEYLDNVFYLIRKYMHSNDIKIDTKIGTLYSDLLNYLCQYYNSIKIESFDDCPICSQLIKQFKLADLHIFKSKNDWDYSLANTHLLIKKMVDENELSVYASDYDFSHFDDILSKEEMYTMSAYFKCTNCNNIHFLGVCIRGWPIYRNNISKDDVDSFIFHNKMIYGELSKHIYYH